MKLLLLLFIFLPLTISFADDDLLSILENSPVESLMEEHSELEQVLKNEIGTVTAEQNIFFTFLRKNEFEKALFQWPAAFEDSKFAETPSGQALYAYLILKNSMPIIALEKLFQIKDVNKIPRLLKQIWHLEVPSEHRVWRSAHLQWRPEWREVFDLNSEVLVQSRQKFDLAQKTEIFDLLKKSKLKSNVRYWVEWQMALSLAMNNEVGKSAKVLAHLLNENQQVISKELITITAARLLYERGFLDAAIEYYKKIDKGSEYWFVAQEEMAWAYMRKGQPQDTLAIAKTQVVDEFAPHTGPEMLFLKALAHLKLCDYKDAAETLFLFKKRFYSRTKVLLKVQEQGLTPATEKLVSELKKGRVKLLTLGPAAYQVPRYLTRDEYLMDLVRGYASLEKEANTAGDLYSRSLSGGTAQVGFQAFLENFKHYVEVRLQAAKSATYNLIQLRAKDELAEIHQILQKMHIVEAELLQQSAMSEQVANASQGKASSAKIGTIKSAKKDDLVFPYEGEKWFDELSNYRIDVNKACQVSRKAE